MAVKVIVCVSTDRSFLEKEVPVPICPSILEVQTRELPVKVPSSASSPEPLKVIESPSVYVLPSEGLVMFTVGGMFGGGGFTVILTELLLVAPSLSVAVKVIVCVPTDRSFLEKEVPVPICPSILEVQTG